MKKILPLGSIVKLKRGEQKLMIIARVPLYNNQGTIGYFDYSGCRYPYGQTDLQQFFFNEEDIEEVVFEGFSDGEEIEFCNLYSERIDKVSFPKLFLKFEDEE